MYSTQSSVTTSNTYRNNLAEPHTVLWQEFKKRDLRYKFKPKVGLGKFVVDFYCPELKLVVEIEYPEVSGWVEKEKWLVTRGYTILRFNHIYVIQEYEKIVDKVFVVCLHLVSLS